MESFYLCNSEIFGLSNSTAVIYNFLCRVNNVTTGRSFYKRSNIAKNCNVSESTVSRSLRTLCAKGLLEIKRRFDEKGRQTSNDYILIENPQQRIRSDSPPDIPLKAVEAKKADKGERPRLFPLRVHAGTGGLSPNAMKVYSYLSFRAGVAGQCMPSKKVISNDCSISMTTAWRVLCELRNAGWVEIRRQTRLKTCGNNGTSVNLYIIRAESGAADADSGDFNINDHRLLLGEQPSRKNNNDTNNVSRLLSTLLVVHDTLSDFTHDTPRTMSRKKITINSRIRSCLLNQIKTFIKRFVKYSTMQKAQQRLNKAQALYAQRSMNLKFNGMGN